MNNIKMIPIGRLKHHPENPRKDLGDLTELAESIKKNGIMQNLTVVFEQLGEVATGRYLVVIGNRRMEAAKMAGLEELPCVVSDMDHKEQIATMLMENMQRADLTVYEQAQGFQMMMDLGFRAEEISEKTGFSEKTVKDRIKLTKINQKNFSEAVAKGATLMDMLEISKLKSKADQNEVMKEVGTNNFRHKLTSKLAEQKFGESCEKLEKLAKEAGLKGLPENANVYGGGEYTWSDQKATSADSEDKIRKMLKKAVKENEGEELFYKFSRQWNDDTALMTVLKKNRKKSAAELSDQEKKAKEEQRAKQKRLREVKKQWAEAYRLRMDFIRNYTVTNGTGMTTIGKLIAKYALSQQNSWNHKLPENQHWKEKYIRDTLEIKQEDYEDKRSIWELAEARGIPMIRTTLAWIMGGGVFDADDPELGRYYYADGEFTMNNNSGMLTERYEFLQEIGYQMSDMEKQLMDGTHEVYKGAEA